MATQSHRSNGPQGPTTAGPPESSPLWAASVPSGDELPGNGNEDAMTSSGKIRARVGYKWILTLLFAFAISLLNSTEARADDRCVLDYGGVIDGLVTANPPAQLQIDGNCIIR